METNFEFNREIQKEKNIEEKVLQLQRILFAPEWNV